MTLSTEWMEAMALRILSPRKVYRFGTCPKNGPNRLPDEDAAMFGHVDDLEATMSWFTEVAGYTWTDVVTVDQQAVTPDGEVTIPMKMVYSGADPRLELLQTVAGTVWIPADSGVHHIGYWSDDVESDLATLESNGLTYEVKSYNPDGSGTLLWAYAKGPTGPRIELVSRGMEPFIAYWWSTAGGESQ